MAGTKHYKDWPNAAGFNAIEDHRTPIELTVNGTIPSYAAGTLYRVGPGGYKLDANGKKDGFACSHWFDGFTVVHRFALSADDMTRVTYSSYCQTDELIEQCRKTGRRDDISFGQKRDPCDGLYKKVKTMFTPTPAATLTPHAASIGVVLRDTLPQEIEHAKKQGVDVTGRKLVTVTTDADLAKTFDAETLEPLGVTKQTNIHPSLTGSLSAAHAECDPKTGDIFNYNLDLSAKATWRIFRASPSTGKVDILATVSELSLPGAYLHSLLLTENFVVLCMWPAYYKMKGISILWEHNVLDAIQPFNPKTTATWLVIDRKHSRGLVKKFTSPAFFCFHTVNAWEVPSKAGQNDVDIICELVEFDDMSLLHQFYYENLVSDGAGTQAFHDSGKAPRSGGLARYALKGVSRTRGSSARMTALAEKLQRVEFPNAGDLPRYNPKYALREHRYVWAVANRGRSSFIDGVVKTDTLTKKALFWECDKHTPGEPIFVPRPDAVEEDDGVLLTVVLDGLRGTSYLLCLDAKTMKELGRADVGHAVGLGFHGSFVA